MNKKIKVVHLVTLLELGGAQGNTIHTVKNLDKEKYDVYLWSGKGAYWDKEVSESLEGTNKIQFFSTLVRQVNPIYDFLTLVRLWMRLRKLKPSILHTHSSKAGILGRIAGHLAGVPTIIHTFHGFGFNQKQKPFVRWLFVTLEKWVAPFSSKLIFVSESNLNEAKEKKIGNENQYILIRSGIPLKKIREEAGKVDKKKLKKDLGLKPDSLVVTTIGAFKPQKNLADFVEIAQKLKQKNDLVEFLIIGDGVLRTFIQKEIDHRSMGQSIKLLGWRRDVASLLSISDVFIMTSLWEGLPRALVEALTLSVPAVCYETDGVSDLLRLGGGISIKQGDKSKMVESISSILNKKVSVSLDFKPVHEKINAQFDIDEMVKKQDELYQEALNP